MFELSIIIPTYNTSESKLRRCLDSIYSQIEDSTEVIIVDDGSDELFANYLNALQNEYAFRIIRQVNSGVSRARNLGVAESLGKYIMFVDADDSVEAYSIKRGIELAKKYDADIVLGGINIVDNCTVKKCTINQDHELVYNKADIDKLQKYMLAIRCEKKERDLQGLRCTGPWAKLIKKEIIANNRFDEKLQLYEDLLFNLVILDNASVVIVDNNIWYNYYIYSQSAIHRYRANGVDQMMHMLKKLCSLLELHKEWEAAAAIKVMECLGRAFTNTVFHNENKSINRIEQTRAILDNETIHNLLSKYDENSYAFTSVKEKCLWYMYYKKRTLAISIYYTMKKNKKKMHF